MTPILDVWTACLAREAADLDLSDADDRATFRGRVHTATANAVCVLISALARALGTPGSPGRLLARPRRPTFDTRQRCRAYSS